MFDISLFELMVILLVGVFVLEPKDIKDLFIKLKKFNNKFTMQNFLQDDFLDFKEVKEIDIKDDEPDLKNAKRRKK